MIANLVRFTFLALPLIAQTSVFTSFANWDNKDACKFMQFYGLMAEKGYRSLAYEPYHFSCISAIKPLNEQRTSSPQNYVVYDVDGGKNHPQKLTLSLYVNNPLEAASAHVEFAKIGNRLALEATGEELPQMAIQYLKEGKIGAWDVNTYIDRIKREDHPSGKGYDLMLIVERR